MAWAADSTASGHWPEIAVPGTNGALVVRVAPPAVLAAVKRSHLGFAVHWHKHAADYHALKPLLSAEPPLTGDALAGALAAFECVRRSEASERYGDHRVHLDVPNDAFFKVIDCSRAKTYDIWLHPSSVSDLVRV